MKIVQNTLLCSLILLLYISNIWSQTPTLASGPMVGYSEFREVMVWTQTTAPAKVQLKYWETGKKEIPLFSEIVTTDKASAFTAHLLADQVQPGKTYNYEILLNGKAVPRDYPLAFQSQTLWQHRTDPPAVKFAVGSCAYMNDPLYDRPGNPYGGDEQIFTSIHKARPEFMVWLGDNVYYREVDWNTTTGMRYRYTHDRALPELQPLLGSTHHYAIWDDHDYGPNDSDRGYHKKKEALEIFKLFWAN